MLRVLSGLRIVLTQTTDGTLTAHWSETRCCVVVSVGRGHDHSVKHSEAAANTDRELFLLIFLGGSLVFQIKY